MIYVTKKQLNTVEYLIQQSIYGHHVLFDPDALRKVFSKYAPQDTQVESASDPQPHIEQLITLPTLLQKRAYLEKLDAPTFEAVVRGYFNIVENNLYQMGEVLH